MWVDVRRRALGPGAAIVALGLALAARAEPPPVPQAPPRAGLAAKPGPRPAPVPKAAPVVAPAGPPPAPAPNAAPGAAAAPAVVTVRGDRLTVRVSDVPLDEVLRRIAEPGKAEIRGALTTPRNVTADFADVPLQDGLSRLLGEQNFLLTYRVDGRLRRLTLLGGAVEAPAATRVVKAGPDPSPAAPGDLLQRRVSVHGKLETFLGQNAATLQQLMDIALRQDDAGLRSEAVTAGMNALDSQPDLRAAVMQSLDGAGGQAVEGLLRSVGQERATEIVTQLMGARTPELRARGIDLARRVRESMPAAGAP